MKPETLKKSDSHETWSIIVIIALIILGGVFYGIDLYKKAKAPAETAPAEINMPGEGPAVPTT